MVSRVMTRKFIALPLAATLMAAGPALAQQVGTATVVNPVSQGTAPGGATDKLAVGARVMHDFIYDPASNRGHMLTRLTAGTLQYIGGLRHARDVGLPANAGAIGRRE